MKKENNASGTPGQRPYTVQPAGSLGLLALGYRGLIAWREALKQYRDEQRLKGEGDEQQKK